MKTALVTGCAGFVGRHLVPKLERLGYTITGIDPRSDGRRFEDLHLDTQFDVVVHLAANIEDVDRRMKGGHQAYSDILVDYAMADYIAVRPPREAFVWPTSCAVDNPDDPYAWVKLTGEKLFHGLRTSGVRAVFLRPFSGYGADQALSYPFPAILNRALNGADPLTVWGSGRQVRDFVHIDDLTDAFIHAIKNFPAYQPIDIGTGRATNFLELAELMAKEVGYKPRIQPLTDKAESSPRRVANPAEAERYNFRPRISLEEGIRRSVEMLRPQLARVAD